MVLSSPITGLLTKERIRSLVYDELINHSGIDDNSAEDLKKLGDQVVIEQGFDLDTSEICCIIDDLEISMDIVINENDYRNVRTVGDLVNAFVTALTIEERIEG